MLVDDVVIRPLEGSEVEHLAGSPWPGGPPERHLTRLARQHRDEVLYLIGWQGCTPTGHLLLVWTGPADEPVASSVTSCAELQDFVVRPDLRSRGLGRQMLALATELTRRRGFRRLGLFVGQDNPRARALYERHGFVEASFGPLPIRWQSRGPDGAQHWREETADYLVKELA